MPDKADLGLPDHFWSIPKVANTTMTTKQLRAALLKHDGWITACGDMWDIKSKRIGPGVYRVWLERRKLS
jgi:hypothetical protein